MSLIAYRQEGGPTPAANTPATKSNQLVAAPTATKHTQPVSYTHLTLPTTPYV